MKIPHTSVAETRIVSPLSTRLVITCCIPVLAGCAAAIPALHSGAALVAAHISAAPIAAAAGAAGVGLGIGVLAGDDIKRLARQAGDTQFGTQTAGTFGAFLQDTQAEVQKRVQSGMQAQREVVVVAGLQVQGALARAQIAYRDSINLKVERLGDQEKKFIADMESIVADLKSSVDATQKQAGDRAQVMAAGIRVTTDAPLLKSSSPLFLFPGLPYQTITLRGSFPAADAGAGVPELALNGKSYKAFDVQFDTLRFSIPTAAFDAAEPTQIVWQSAGLTVPWNTPVWNITTTTEVAKFSVLMGVLPYSFGRMVVEHQVARVRQEERNIQSGNLKADLVGAAPSESELITEIVDLAWGGKHYFKYGAGTWKLRLSRTGGGVREVAATDLSQPLIRVNADATNVTVSVYPFY